LRWLNDKSFVRQHTVNQIPIYYYASVAAEGSRGATALFVHQKTPAASRLLAKYDKSAVSHIERLGDPTFGRSAISQRTE
jgi:hypothetical protein